ncbi:MAG: coproporphyrinogen III oxidase family protein, partial [Desulfobacteraceae bacterium]|nr:coproporphyrinogen III oxidase family protein [Desulfobacteraceae bacterium]
FKVAHLSCYMLTLESGTPLQAQYEKGLFQMHGPDILTDFFTATSTFLGQQGYEHYEISNFARGRENRSCHNSNYWNMTPYDGFGPSAHSFGFSREKGLDPRDTCPASPVRSWNPADLNAYIRPLSSGLLPAREREVLSCRQQTLERVMLGLRTSDGFDMAVFEKMSGQDCLKGLTPLLARLETEKLGAVLPSGKRFQLNLSGRARLDSIVEAFAEIIL